MAPTGPQRQRALCPTRSARGAHISMLQETADPREENTRHRLQKPSRGTCKTLNTGSDRRAKLLVSLMATIGPLLTLGPETAGPVSVPSRHEKASPAPPTPPPPGPALRPFSKGLSQSTVWRSPAVMAGAKGADVGTATPGSVLGKLAVCQVFALMKTCNHHANPTEENPEVTEVS